MFELAQELSYYASFVDNGAMAGIVGLGQKLWAVSNIATAAQASLSAIVAPLNQIGAAWSQREQQINNITRSLRQYQYVGNSVAETNRMITASMPGASQAQQDAMRAGINALQFEQGRSVSRQVLSEMNRMAAILPGETNDYAQSFSQSLPFLSQARGMTLDRAMRDTSLATAGGIANGIDAGQSARDVMQFLTQGPHLMDRSWTEVWSQVATFHGKRVTAEQIRAMDINKKAEVFHNIAEALGPQMNAMGDSYEATMGTFNSFRHEIYLAGTEPLFDAWKRTIAEVNVQLGRYAAGMGNVLNIISGKLAGGLDWVTTKIRAMGDGVGSVRIWLAEHSATIGNVATTIQNFGRMAGRAYSGGWMHAASYVGNTVRAHGMGATDVIAGIAPMLIMRMLGVAFGPIGMIVTSLITRMFLTGNAGGSITALFGAIWAVIGPLFRLAFTLYRAYDAIMNVLVVVLGALLPSIIMSAAIVLGGVFELLSEIVMVVLNILGFLVLAALFPFMTILIGLSGFIELFIGIFIGVIRLIGSAFGGVAGESFDLIDAIRQTAQAFGEIMHDMSESVNFLLHDWGFRTDEEYAAHQISLANGGNSAGEWLDEFRRNLADMRGNLGRTGHGTSARPQTHNDFRFSRFDITQKFSDGFDPDRVATAFVSDLQQMAETPMSSGFNPGFSSS